MSTEPPQHGDSPSPAQSSPTPNGHDEDRRVGPGHVVVACNSFKGSLTAPEVAQVVAAGLRDAAPDREVRTVVIADGGDGTLDAALSVGFERVAVTATGPTGAPVATGYAVRGGVAVVEMADACGLVRLPEKKPDALRATSRGVGDVLRAALGAGVREIVLGVGGSASTDGGAGMLTALGARVLDAEGEELPDGGAALVDVADLDLTTLHPRLAEVRMTLASDVTNPLLGPAGAVAVFSPQKGAGVAEQEVLERGLTRWADVVTTVTGRDDRELPGAGAAGGVGYAAQAVLGASMRSGIDLVLDLVGFEQLLDEAALVVTGEGALDRQTLSGKAPAGVAQAAGRAGVPVVAVCGISEVSPEEASELGVRAVYPLADVEPDPQRSMAKAGQLLRQVSATVGRDWLTS